METELYQIIQNILLSKLPGKWEIDIRSIVGNVQTIEHKLEGLFKLFVHLPGIAEALLPKIREISQGEIDPSLWLKSENF